MNERAFVVEVIITGTAAEAARIAARVVARVVRSRQAPVLGLATGSTPLGLYAELIRLHMEEGLDFSRTTTFNLDEYVGLAPDHPASYNRFMREHFFDHVNVRPDRIHIPDGAAKDIPRFCAEYEDAIRRAGGIDVQILGIGSDGHIGFNEPSSSLASRTRIKTLTQRTRQDNAVYFGGADKTPKHVITMGVGTIMESRHCILLAFGSRKAQAVAQTVEGPISAMMPASILQMHPSTRIFLDEDSAALLTRADYYRWVHDNKPDWQRE